ncbi:unnamed protein product, partial [Chrysoparadoxa australica]
MPIWRSRSGSAGSTGSQSGSLGASASAGSTTGATEGAGSGGSQSHSTGNSEEERRRRRRARKLKKSRSQPPRRLFTWAEGTLTFFTGLVGTAGVTLSVKSLYQARVVEADGEEVLFDAPLFITTIVMLGAATLLPLSLVGRWMAHPTERPPVAWGALWLLAVPGTFYLGCTACNVYSLRYLTASNYQILSYACIVVFSAMCKVILYGECPRSAHVWVGAVFIIAALCTAAASSLDLHER